MLRIFMSILKGDNIEENFKNMESLQFIFTVSFETNLYLVSAYIDDIYIRICKGKQHFFIILGS